MDKNKKTPMREAAPSVRAQNTQEVSLGYTSEEASCEAARCLNCKSKPCVNGCPVGVDIPAFIKALAGGDPALAAEIISRTNSLPAVCGRVCPQETQCEKLCVRGKAGEPVAIGRLERFAADFRLNNTGSLPEKNNGPKIAVIGAGPAGLTCAGELCRRGYRVTVFEAFHKAGGVLIYGIPEFRLPKKIVSEELSRLERLGVEFVLNCVVGRSVTLDELFQDGYEAIFIGTGAGLPVFMGIPGESLTGVFSANEFLTRFNLMGAYSENADTPIWKPGKCAVIGGGNVAVDAARCALRLGAESVSMVYRRGEDEMPARREEIHHAREEGVTLELLTAPVSLKGNENGRVTALECVRMELGEPDTSGRRRPVEIPDSGFLIEADTVIFAIGTSPNPLIASTTEGIDTDRRGRIIVGGDCKTTKDRVYAGGDAVTGAATVILAMGAGRDAAQAIDTLLQGG